MPAKIFAILALLTLSVSTTIVVTILQCSLAPATALVGQFLSLVTAMGFKQPAQIYIMSLNAPSGMPLARSHAHVIALFTVLFTFLGLSLFLYRAKTTSLLKKTELHRLPPGPAGLPILGNIHCLVSRRPLFQWIHCLFKDMNTNVLCLRFGAVHVIVVGCPEIARGILRKNDAVFASRPLTFASELFSFGYKGSILAPYGEQWKKMRRVLTFEILSTSMEQRLQGQRAEEADHLIRFVYNQCNISGTTNNIIDVRHVARHFCGNMIRRLVFSKRHFYTAAPAGGSGNNVSSPGPDEVAHVDALFTILNYVYSFSISDYIPAQWMWMTNIIDPDGHKKVAKSVMKTLNRLHDPIIEERIHEWHTLRNRGDKREARDFLDALVSLDDSQGRPLLSFDEIKAQTAEIMFAIVDNPSNAVEWALAEMMNKPEVMDNAIDELNGVVGKDRLVQESHIPNLNYLKACIREAFRLHPYHAFNPPHVTMEDAIVSGFLIPKGTHVLLSRVGLGRNSDVWDDPLQFRPERHLMMDKSEHAHVVLAEPDLRFITFSTGRRGCPGVSLGTSITMMLFARLLQGYTWTKPPGVHAIDVKECTASLVLAEPLLLQAQPRLPMQLYTSG